MMQSFKESGLKGEYSERQTQEPQTTRKGPKREKIPLGNVRQSTITEPED